jgi:DNA-binding response OmpR family regulator
MKKILVVDDDIGILEAFELVLIEAGYEVETSTKDGEYILERIRVNRPDLIILDVLLSGSDGRTICKKLKGNKTTEAIPIIMVSAHPDAEKSVKECGANDFIAKPFEMEQLIKKIKVYLNSE